jgi:hypothetical protein
MLVTVEVDVTSVERYTVVDGVLVVVMWIVGANQRGFLCPRLHGMHKCVRSVRLAMVLLSRGIGIHVKPLSPSLPACGCFPSVLLPLLLLETQSPAELQKTPLLCYSVLLFAIPLFSTSLSVGSGSWTGF